MRIALLSSQAGYYGGEVHLHDLATELHARGHQVTCIVRPGSGLARRLDRSGLPVVRSRLLAWFDPASVGRLRRTLGERRPDILHTHSPRDYYLAATASLGLPVCNVATRHQLHPIAFPPLKRPFLRRFGAIIAVSEAVRDGLLASGLPARQLVTVPNGVRLASRREAPAQLRRELALPPDGGPVIGFVGRLCPTKGPDRLLWAASLLRGRWPGLQVVLIGGDAGDGVFTQRLRAMGRELRLAVRICGYRDDAARLMPAFDVLAVPSRAEPFGLVTLEALARGVPVVATSSGGSREIIRDGKEGLLVAPEDPEALAAAIHRLLSEHALHARCAAAGPRRVREHFALERQVAATEKVYSLALAGSPLPEQMPLSAAGPEPFGAEALRSRRGEG